MSDPLLLQLEMLKLMARERKTTNRELKDWVIPSRAELCSVI